MKKDWFSAIQGEVVTVPQATDWCYFDQSVSFLHSLCATACMKTMLSTGEAWHVRCYPKASRNRFPCRSASE